MGGAGAAQVALSAIHVSAHTAMSAARAIPGCYKKVDGRDHQRLVGAGQSTARRVLVFLARIRPAPKKPFPIQAKQYTIQQYRYINTPFREEIPFARRRSIFLMRVLIAEDDPVSRRVLEAHLTKWGYEVQVTCDGQEAWAALQADDCPHLAILDWMMPAMDGVDVVRNLRAKQSSKYIYTLLLTAKGQKEDIVAGLEAGADDYLTKPFDAHELNARIRTGRRILDLQHELLSVQDALRKEATHDYLTGVWNRAGILDVLQRECARTVRAKKSVAVIMADIDHFKAVNDTYGHLAGDEVLREVAKRMHNSVRSYDSIGRYGGEEFVIVLPDCEATSGFQQAERLRQNVGSGPVVAASFAIPITLSLGVAILTETHPEDYQALLRTADAALYRAKESGRNQTCMGEIPVQEPARGR